MSGETFRTFVDEILERLDEEARDHPAAAEDLLAVRRYIEAHRALLERLPYEALQNIVYAALLRARGGVGMLPPTALTPDEINAALRENADMLDRLLEKQQSLGAFLDGLVQIASAAVLRFLAAALTS
ncbi:MAG: hypothetical protein AB7D00_14960 [Rhodospirillaceae bacterium]